MRHKLLTLATITLCATAATAAEPPGDSSAQSEEEPALGTRPNTPLLVSGAVVGGVSFGVPFGISVTYFALVWPFQAAFGDPTPPDTILWMMVPLVGPIFAAQTDYSQGERGLQTAFYIDSALQFVGLGLVVSSFAFRQKVRAKPVGLRFGPGPSGSAGLTLGVDLW